MLDNGFEPEFSDEMDAQLASIGSRDLIAEADDAKDLRDLEWSSIDNKTSGDLDQVEWAEQMENGDIRVLVGIADVDAAVAVGLVWVTHIGVDRAVGYGLKYPTRFEDTHLQRV